MSAARALNELVAIATQRAAHTTAVVGEAIVLEDLAKTYPDGTEAVRGISLRVASGEAYGILGPNGAGKSTTIGMLGTLVRPTRGRAEVAGFDVVTSPVEVRRRIGFAMQQAGVDDFATASELMILQGRLHGLPKAAATRRAELLLRVMELEQVAGKRLQKLSGGMKRRVDLAASLMHLPPILILDEPTEGLDPRSRSAIWDTLDHLRHQLGTTLVLTTHYMDEADRLCDHIAIIDRGAVVVQGTPQALKSTVGSQALVIRFGPQAPAHDLTIAERALADLGEVRQIFVAERDISVFADDAAALAPDALHLLQAADLVPRSIAITQPTLEDVYLRYTGRAFDSDPDRNSSDEDVRRAA